MLYALNAHFLPIENASSRFAHSIRVSALAHPLAASVDSRGADRIVSWLTPNSVAKVRRLLVTDKAPISGSCSTASLRTRDTEGVRRSTWRRPPAGEWLIEATIPDWYLALPTSQVLKMLIRLLPLPPLHSYD